MNPPLHVLLGVCHIISFFCMTAVYTHDGPVTPRDYALGVFAVVFTLGTMVLTSGLVLHWIFKKDAGK